MFSLTLVRECEMKISKLKIIVWLCLEVSAHFKSDRSCMTYLINSKAFTIPGLFLHVAGELMHRSGFRKCYFSCRQVCSDTATVLGSAAGAASSNVQWVSCHLQVWAALMTFSECQTSSNTVKYFQDSSKLRNVLFYDMPHIWCTYTRSSSPYKGTLWFHAEFPNKLQSIANIWPHLRNEEYVGYRRILCNQLLQTFVAIWLVFVSISEKKSFRPCNAVPHPQPPKINK